MILKRYTSWKVTIKHTVQFIEWLEFYISQNDIQIKKNHESVVDICQEMNWNYFSIG